MPSPPPPLTVLPASTAIKLLTSSHPPPLLVDAQPPKLHQLERVSGSVPPPPVTALRRHPPAAALVYDTGSTAAIATSPAVRELARLHAAAPAATLFLVSGGLPAMRAIAPHLVLGPLYPTSSSQLLSPSPFATFARFPWATEAVAAATARSVPPAQVRPRLYVGSAAFAFDPDWRAEHKITHLLSVGDEFVKSHLPSDLECMPLPVRDAVTEDIIAILPAAVSFIRQALQSPDSVILVHCLAGASRSVAVTAAYLIADGLDRHTALQNIKLVRPVADPNAAFVAQLDVWQTMLTPASPLSPHGLAPPAPPHLVSEQQPALSDAIQLSSSPVTPPMRPFVFAPLEPPPLALPALSGDTPPSATCAAPTSPSSPSPITPVPNSPS